MSDEARAMRVKSGYDRYIRRSVPSERQKPLDGTIVRAYPDYETGEWGTEVLDYDGHRYYKEVVVTVFDIYNVCFSMPLRFLEEVEPRYV